MKPMYCFAQTQSRGRALVYHVSPGPALASVHGRTRAMRAPRLRNVAGSLSDLRKLRVSRKALASGRPPRAPGSDREHRANSQSGRTLTPRTSPGPVVTSTAGRLAAGSAGSTCYGGEAQRNVCRSTLLMCHRRRQARWGTRAR